VVRPTGGDPALGHQALKLFNAEGLGVCEVREKGSSAVPLGTPVQFSRSSPSFQVICELETNP